MLATLSANNSFKEGRTKTIRPDLTTQSSA